MFKWARRTLPKCYQVLNQRAQRRLGERVRGPMSFYLQSQPLDLNYFLANGKK